MFQRRYDSVGTPGTFLNGEIFLVYWTGTPFLKRLGVGKMSKINWAQSFPQDCWKFDALIVQKLLGNVWGFQGDLQGVRFWWFSFVIWFYRLQQITQFLLFKSMF